MKQFAATVIRYRVLVLIIALAATAGLGAMIPRLQADDDVMQFMPDDDPDIKTATVGTLDYWIPFTVFGIVRGGKTAASARVLADAVIENLERVLRDQNGAANQLGIGALVHGVKSNYRPQREKSAVYGRTATRGTAQHKVAL